MQTVIRQEKEICQALNRRDPFALRTLEDMFIFFEYDYKSAADRPSALNQCHLC